MFHFTYFYLSGLDAACLCPANMDGDVKFWS